jgi:hypothetical protein
MSRRLRSLLAFLLVAYATVAVLSAGCFRNTASPQETVEDDGYPVRSHPDSVMLKFNMAYVAMDLEAYLDCLADTFQFHLRDQDCNNPDVDLPCWWGKGCEDTIHTRMFGVEDMVGVDGIQLTMYNETAVFDPGEPGDPYDDRWMYREEVDLRVTIGDWIFLANGDQEFVFAIEPGRAETLWQIVDWIEVDPWDREEDSSWGSIKALFR